MTDLLPLIIKPELMTLINKNRSLQGRETAGARSGRGREIFGVEPDRRRSEGRDFPLPDEQVQDDEQDELQAGAGGDGEAE